MQGEPSSRKRMFVENSLSVLFLLICLFLVAAPRIGIEKLLGTQPLDRYQLVKADIAVKGDSLLVSELIRVDFDCSSTRHGIIRFLPVAVPGKNGEERSLEYKIERLGRRKSGDEEFKQFENSVAEKDGVLEIKLGSEEDSLEGRSYEYSLVYEVNGAINTKDDTRVLIWPVNQRFEVPLERIEARVELPGGLRKGDLKAESFFSAIEREEDRFRFVKVGGPEAQISGGLGGDSGSAEEKYKVLFESSRVLEARESLFIKLEWPSSNEGAA